MSRPATELKHRAVAEAPAALSLLAAACGAGANDPGCADGPETVLSGDLKRWCRLRGVEVNISSAIEPAHAAGRTAVEVVAEVCHRLARQVRGLVVSGNRFVVLGGDHSCAIGTWSGARDALKGRGPLSLLWIDAHMDSHTPATSPSGNLHGMPLAGLLGFGPRALTGMTGPGPVLHPARVCLIGVRSYEEAERRLLAHLGVKVFFMDDVRRRGLAAVMDEAFALVSRGSAHFGVSVDLDALDPKEAPGVSLPVPGGLHAGELVETVQALAARRGFLGLEIAEFNPRHDRFSITAHIVRYLIAAAGGNTP